jgi:plastocyanin
VQFSDSGIYTVTVSNVTSQIATSNQAILKVNPAPVAPSITVQPQAITTLAGDTVTFSVTATGTAPLSYLWFKDGAAVIGAISPICTLSNVQPANAGTYSVTVSNGISPNATSNGAILTVNSITLQPQLATVNIGDNVTFTATTIGATPNSYQWYMGGNQLSGNSSSYTVNSVQSTDLGNYWVVVTYTGLGSLTSNVVSISLSQSP